MSRSVLPSTARARAAKSLALIRRSHRHSVRQQLGELKGPAEVEVLESFDLGSIEAYPMRAIRDEIFERRSADKVAPLIRWAVGSTRHLRIEDRLSHLAAALPANLIGAHAVSHLEWEPELNPPERVRRYWYYRSPDPLAVDAVTLRAVLIEVLESGGHRAFNAAVTRNVGLSQNPGDHDGSEVLEGFCRPLLGHHDLDGYVTYLIPSDDIRARPSEAGRLAINALRALGYLPGRQASTGRADNCGV